MNKNENTSIEYKGRTITYGIRIPSCWAKSAGIYECGYRSEKTAINAVKRRIDAQEAQ